VAFGFGLRHAVDPDHIAAIDNTTRKLMQDGQRPVAVGFFFSLGHSTVVFLLSVLIALSAAFVKRNLPRMQNVDGVIGTSVSGVFLVLIAVINLIVLVDIYRTWRTVVRGGTYDDKTLDDYLSNRGLIARLLKPLLRVVRHSWHMYPIGLLFGLGFDTASEVGILGMSALGGSKGLPVWSILLLPLLFVAGMSLVDTTDGAAMLGAYGWAYIRPVRKLYYNMSITMISVLIALLIGGLDRVPAGHHPGNGPLRRHVGHHPKQDRHWRLGLLHRRPLPAELDRVGGVLQAAAHRSAGRRVAPRLQVPRNCKPVVIFVLVP
jgi:high-affinity nickel-transport protein